MATADPAPPPADETARPVLSLAAGRHKRVRAGHPWVYSNEIQMTQEAKALPPGTMVALADHGGAPLGTAMFNPHTLICARMISTEPGARIDRVFLADRLRRALALRTRLFDTPFYRLAWSEADGLPGLVLDRYGDICVAQINTAGMERIGEALLAAIEEVVAPRSVVLRNDSPARGLEGLGSQIALRGAAIDGPVEILENGVRFLCDPAKGQKTGWFFDHRENRARVAALAGGKDVLDAYSYLGGFGLQAAVAGARSTTCVDSSAAALELAERSAALNRVGAACSFIRDDVFKALDGFARAGRDFDIVICDPPAFVKAKKDLAGGLKGYRKLIRLAAARVRPGGFLFIASCSHHVDAAAFGEATRGALRDARRSGRVIHAGGAAPDHPIHPYLPESAYLKAALLQLD